MNISTYESQIKALEAGGGGGGGSSDGLFVITIDQNMSIDKTFSEVKNAVLDNAFIVISFGKSRNTIPESIIYTDDESNIYIAITSVSAEVGTNPLGLINHLELSLHPDNSLEIDTDASYNFTLTEA